MAGSIEDIMKQELAQLNKSMRGLDADVRDIKSIMVAQYSENQSQSQMKDQHANAIDKMREQHERARQQEFQESIEKGQQNTKNSLDELNENSKKALKTQSDNGRTANEYLQNLMTLTRSNNEAQKRGDNAGLMTKSLNAIGGRIDELSSKYGGYTKHSDTAGFAMGNTSQIAKGVKDLFGDVGKVGKKIGAKFGYGSDGRTRAIEKDTSALNAIKMQTQAREAEAFKLESEGKKAEADKLRDSIAELNAKRDQKAESVSKNTSTEYMHQLKKSNPAYKKINSDDQKLMTSQMKDKMKASLVGDARKSSDVKDSGVKLQRVVRPIKSPNGIKDGIVAAKENKEEAGIILGENVLKTKIKGSKTPNNFGQYIAGIYDQLLLLNREKPIEEKKEDDGGGGLAGMLAMVGGLLATMKNTLGKLLVDVVGKSLKGLGSSIASVAGKSIAGIASKVGIKFAEKAAVDVAAKTATSTAVKGATSVAAKGATEVAKKGAVSTAGKLASQSAARAIPGIGVLASGGLTYALTEGSTARKLSAATGDMIGTGLGQLATGGFFGGVGGGLAGMHAGTGLYDYFAGDDAQPGQPQTPAKPQMQPQPQIQKPAQTQIQKQILNPNPINNKPATPTQLAPDMQSTVNMQSHAIKKPDGKSQMEFARVQANLIADAIAKRNQQPDVVNQKMAEIQETQKPWWKLT